MARSEKLLWLAGLTYVALYISQGVIFSVLMAKHIGSSFGAFFVGFLPSLGILFYFVYKYEYAKNDGHVFYVWTIWFAYIAIAFVPSVVLIFTKVIHTLKNEDTPGINTLRLMLCTTPIFLVLLLNMTISPEHRKFVLALSLIASVDLFDGIEILQVILLQHQTEPFFFELSNGTTASIIFFACLSFVVSPLALCQHKLTGNREGDVKKRRNTTIIKATIQIVVINLPLLVLRAYIWAVHGYESSIFMIKNIVSLVAGTLEIASVFKLFECGPDELYYGQVNHL